MTLLVDGTTTAGEAPVTPRRRHRVPRVLFPEAEEHRRFRRRRTRSLVATVLVVAGVAAGLVEARGGSGAPGFGLAAASFRTSVAFATRSGHSARISVTVDNGVDHCVARSEPTGVGVVDFDAHTLLLERPASACGSLAFGKAMKAEVVNGKVFTDFPSRTATHRPGPAVWHVVLQEPPGSGTALFSSPPIARAVSPAPWRVLDALTGPVHTVGHATIGDVRTTEYRGHASLASLVAVYPSIRVGLNGVGPRARLSKLLLPASKVDISILVWLDAEHRLVRMELAEPAFEADIPRTRGGLMPGFDLPRTVGVPRDPTRPDSSGSVTVRLRHFRQIATDRVEIELYGFGAAAAIREPRTTHVAA